VRERASEEVLFDFFLVLRRFFGHPPLDFFERAKTRYKKKKKKKRQADTFYRLHSFLFLVWRKTYIAA